jgi:molybdenum cofactor cytidylyltransferase
LIAAIILAAGKSERMGSPKALLRYKGESFLERILRAVADSPLHPIVVVAGHHVHEIQAAPAAPPVVYNPDYEKGMCTSVQTGLRSLPAGCSGAAIFLVDHPLIDAPTIHALLAHAAPGRIVVPVHGSKRGHPVILASDLFAEVLGLGPDQGLNVVVRRDSSRVVEVPVTSSGILCDVDTPADLEKLIREEG